MLLGGWWIWSVLAEPGARLLWGEKKPQDYFFLLVVPALSLPGILAILFGFRLIREKAPRNYKGTLGVLAVFAVFWFSYQLEQGFGALVNEKIKSNLFMFLTTMVVIPAYVSLATWLMRREGIKVAGIGSLIGKGTILIVALQIWFLGSDLFEAYAPIKAGYTHIYEEPWGFLAGVLPLASAYLFYKVANWRLAKGAAGPTDGNHSQGQNELNGSAPA